MSSLIKPVLILNKSWSAVGVKSVKRCIIKVFSGLARFLDPIDFQLYTFDDWLKLQISSQDFYSSIQMTHGQLRAPEIIVLTSYNGFRMGSIKLNKKNLLVRDDFRCQYSGQVLTFKTATVDHVIPKSLGGKTTWNNLVICSKDINRKKANKLPGEVGLKLLKAPKKPKWNPCYAYYMENRPPSWGKFLNTKMESEILPLYQKV